MNAFLNSEEYDILGSVSLTLLESDTEFGDTTRRVNRIATLDGGVVFNDWGFVNGDKTFTLVFPMDRELQSSIDRIVRIHRRVILSSEIGCYKGAISAFSQDGNNGNITFLVQERLDEA